MSIDHTAFRYHYDALVREVYDGDTMYADIDLGLGTWHHGEPLRLAGIDTPELRSPTLIEGYAVRDFVCAALVGCRPTAVGAFARNKRRVVLPAPVPVFLHSHGDDGGKYGRLLATVWFYDEHDELVCLNELLLTEGLAHVPSYA